MSPRRTALAILVGPLDVHGREQPALSLDRYDRGEFLYERVGGGDVLDPSFFGETCIPRRYVEEKWTELFTFLDYIDDPTMCVQNAIVVKA